jgi:hypothetical protein
LKFPSINCLGKVKDHLLNNKSMGKHKKFVRFQPGDRVAEKPKATFIAYISNWKSEIVAKNCKQRYGIIVSVCQKQNRNGIKSTYYQVKWDNNTTGEHAQARLCFESELPQILEEYTANLYKN